MQEAAELISLGMTFPTVILAIAVVYTWFPSVKKAIKSQDKEAQDWFIIGVVAGFIGATLDNLYWFIPWTASFLDHPWFGPLTSAGVFFNVFFRQGLGIVAAYCHLKAAEKSISSSTKMINALLFAGWAMGVGYSVSLILLGY